MSHIHEWVMSRRCGLGCFDVTHHTPHVTHHIHSCTLVDRSCHANEGTLMVHKRMRRVTQVRTLKKARDTKDIYIHVWYIYVHTHTHIHTLTHTHTASATEALRSRWLPRKKWTRVDTGNTVNIDENVGARDATHAPLAWRMANGGGEQSRQQTESVHAMQLCVQIPKFASRTECSTIV